MTVPTTPAEWNHQAGPATPAERNPHTIAQRTWDERETPMAPDEFAGHARAIVGNIERVIDV